MKIVILDANPLKTEEFSRLNDLGCELVIHGHTKTEKIVEHAQDADIVLTNKTPLRADVIAALPKLKYIGMISTGFDVVDLKAAAERGIPVCNVPDYSSEAVAQHVFALLLAFHRRVEHHDQSVKLGCWSRSIDHCYWDTPQLSLNNKTMGIVGFGTIGRKIGKIAHGFDMDVLAYSPKSRVDPGYDRFAYAELEEVFAKSDIVSLSCPLRDDNRGFVNARLLNMMKPGAFFINTARGPLVNEADLAAALREGKIAGAGLDVISVEPPSPFGNPLFGAPNCIITPHLAWAADKAVYKLIGVMLDNIKAWKNGAPENVVNKSLMK